MVDHLEPDEAPRGERVAPVDETLQAMAHSLKMNADATDHLADGLVAIAQAIEGAGSSITCALHDITTVMDKAKLEAIAMALGELPVQNVVVYPSTDLELLMAPLRDVFTELQQLWKVMRTR